MRPLTKMLILGCLAAYLVSCATTDEMTVGKPCPVSIDRASAWINRMPGSGAPTLHVRVYLAQETPSTGNLRLRKSRQSSKNELILTIDSEQDGSESDLRYRENVSDSELTSVVLECNGSEVFRISEIKTVY